MRFGFQVWLVAGLAMCALHSSGQAAERPNIVLVLSDDMGYSDIGCFGGEIQTPTLDRLAHNGVRLTQFYNTARCCSTRAALLTGLYSHQAGIGHMTEDKGFPAYRGDLSPHSVTIAEALRPAGYRNYAVGKWHVTKRVKPEAPNDNWPLQRGFDRYYGTLVGAGNFFDPGALMRDNTAISALADPEYRPAEYYYTDAISDHAVKFVAEHQQQHASQPFFMYVAYTAAHWPMQALPADIAKYAGKYDAGYDAIRQQRLSKLKELKLFDPRWEPTRTVGNWEQVANKEWEARCMEVYAAMVDRMDQGLGKLIAELERTKQLDNTLFIYLQDNGGCAEAVGRGKGHEPRAAELPQAATAVHQAVITKQLRDGRPVRVGSTAMPGPADTYIAYGQGWANVSNTPFREYKHWEHEGGISTPAVIHWPAGIPTAQRNQLQREPAHLVDIMATCLAVSGATYPTTRSGVAVTPAPGVNLQPALQGQPLARREQLYFEHEGNKAVRDGQWKLVAKHKGAWELYDMAADRTELHDLAQQQPERVAKLAALWTAWSERVGVQAWPVKNGGR